MKENKKIPVGYMDSPVGVIPKDWRINILGKIVEFLDGQRKPIKDSDREKIKGIYPYYGASGIIDYINNYIFDEELILLGEDGANIINRSTPLAFKVVGKIWVNNHAHVLRPITKYVEINYLTEYLESIDYTRFNTGTAQPKLNKEICSKLLILLPPLSEQKKIAEILSTWDDAIEAQNKLVDKLKLRKQALIQQLLTKKKRLKGFDKEWRTIQIRDIAKEVSIKNKNNEQITVLSCTKYKGLVPSLEYFGKRIFAEDVSSYKIVHKGHFAYATNHIEEGSIGYQNLYEKGLISPMYTVFKTELFINDKFFFSLLKSHKLIHHYNSRMEGSIDRRGGLRWDSFSGIKVNIPDNEEQTAIANILSTADKEIEIANAKLDKLREQKKGLMQQLLTGKKRVKLN